MSDGTSSGPHRGSVALGVAATLFGLAVLGGLVYADTATVTDSDYETHLDGCSELAGQTRYVEGGVGERETLNQSDVRACLNTTFAEYRRDRVASMLAAPLNPAQWVFYGGIGLSGLALGGYVLWRQFASGG